MKPGELAEIMDDSPELQFVPFHVKGPNGTLGFAGLEDFQVVEASSKTGRPAGTDAAYWLSRVDQIHEEWREQTAIAHRAAQQAENEKHADDMSEMLEESRNPVGRTLQLADGRVATVRKLEASGWLTLRTADGELLGAFFSRASGRSLSAQLAAYPPQPISPPHPLMRNFDSASGGSFAHGRKRRLSCPLAEAVAAAKVPRLADDDDAASEACSEGSDAVSNPVSPVKKTGGAERARQADDCVFYTDLAAVAVA